MVVKHCGMFFCGVRENGFVLCEVKVVRNHAVLVEPIGGL
jgi:hypothetical protein